MEIHRKSIGENNWDPTLRNNNNNNNNNNNSSAINHKIHTETYSVLDCEIYWVSKLLQKGAKCNIYKTIIRTAMLDRCQSWTVTNTDRRNLSISERKVLRKIYYPSRVNWLWRIKK